MLFIIIVIMWQEQLLGIRIFIGIPVNALRIKKILPLSRERTTEFSFTAIIFK